MTKLRIDLKNGFLEVEGEETFVKEIFGEYKDVLGHLIARQAETNQVPALEAPAEEQGGEALKVKKPKKASGAAKNTGVKETHTILGDINFKLPGKPSLKDFIADKKPKEEGGELVTILVYYMQKILGIENLTADHVYTAYKEAGVKVPTALNQSMKNIRSRQGWLDTSDMNNIRTTIKGDNLVEIDLPRAKGTEAV